MIWPALVINLFFVPALSLYLFYKRRNEQLAPSIELLCRYCILASLDYVLTKVLLNLAMRVTGGSYAVDSAHYTLFALCAAWLLPQLYPLTRHVQVGLTVERLPKREERPHGEESDE